jgi:Methyltransferase domain
MPRTSHTRLVAKKAGILLDCSLGGTPQANAVTFADLKASPLFVPWPLPDRSCHTIVITHVVEFLQPSQWFRFWNEVHRVLRLGGIVYCSGPWGGDESQGWLSDPTHQTRVVDQSFAWLDPRLPFYALHPTLGRPVPKPFHLLVSHRVPGENGTVSYNVTLRSVAPTNGKNGKEQR